MPPIDPLELEGHAMDALQGAIQLVAFVRKHTGRSADDMIARAQLQNHENVDAIRNALLELPIK